MLVTMNFLNSLDIEHTAENIRDKVLEVLGKYDAAEKVVCSTTDNASNITKAMSEAGFPNFGGFAHTLNLVVNNALRIVSGFMADDNDNDALDGAASYFYLPTYPRGLRRETSFFRLYLQFLIEQISINF